MVKLDFTLTFSTIREVQTVTVPGPAHKGLRIVRENYCRLSLRESSATFAERKATIRHLLICRYLPCNSPKWEQPAWKPRSRCR